MNQNIRNKICCIKMLNAVLDNWISEVVSGFFFPNKDRNGCKSGIPRITFCPFCGKEFETLRTDNSWDWRVK